YSCGAICLSINNLPREDRYKNDNAVLIGLLPGQDELKTSEMNRYLCPIVEEITTLCVGVVITHLGNWS
ncbi:hypothetical protein CLU79DRAFT_699680, partial [Phycomyces nitens]